MSSTSESSEPTSPRRAAPDFNDWSVQPMPLDAAKHGEEAVFWDNFHGSPTIVQRRKYNEHNNGCIVYTKEPIPASSRRAWRITVLENSNWPTGLTIGLTPALPESVPPKLPLHKELNYEIQYASEPADARVLANALIRSPRLFWAFPKDKSICLILTAKGDLHIYFDERHIKKIATGLPVNKPLWGVVDVSGRCARIKSELLVKPPRGETATPWAQPCPDVPLSFKECFQEKRSVKVEVPPASKTCTIAPRGLGIVLKVPPEAIEETDAPLTFVFSNCTPQSFVYAASCKSLVSPIYYTASNKPLEREIELLLELNVNVESVEQAGELFFCHGNLPEDGSNEIPLRPLEGGKFEVGKKRGSLITNQLGFFVAATKATHAPATRYAVMCSYSNDDGDTKHVGLSISVANEVYMTNFTDALTKVWSSVSHLSEVPVDFEDSSVNVSFPANDGDWKIFAYKEHCKFLKEVVDYEGRDGLSRNHYPPRFIFTIKASESAKDCVQRFSVTGLNRPISFQIPLNPIKSRMSQNDVEKPTLLTLIELGDIRIIEESACEYQNIGIILLTDTHGDRVAEIEHDNTTDTARMREIYKKWLKQGASWATLCDCLNRCHLEALANKIRSHFGIVSPAPLPANEAVQAENRNQQASVSGSAPDEATETTLLLPSQGGERRCCPCVVQ